MDFGNLLGGLLANQNNPFTGGSSLPPIKSNMAPPANFWEGNKFKIGAPGLQATPVSDPSHPANPANPNPAPTPRPPVNTPPPPPAWQSYAENRPDIMRSYTEQNIANSPHLLRGGGRGADLDSNGSISRPEFYQWHYNTHGPGAQAQKPTPQMLPYMGGPQKVQNPFLTGAA